MISIENPSNLKLYYVLISFHSISDYSDILITTTKYNNIG